MMYRKVLIPLRESTLPNVLLSSGRKIVALLYTQHWKRTNTSVGKQANFAIIQCFISEQRNKNITMK